MENVYLELNENLTRAFKKYQTEPIFKVGILNDELLAEIIEKIRHNPTLENFILFTNCLNFFYSTRLQAAVDRDDDVLKTKNDIIINVAKKLQRNWKEGLVLCNEANGEKINCQKVEDLRIDLKDYLKRGTYSFSTKVFHQLNDGYPILDTNVNKFMQVEAFRNGYNFNLKDVSYCTFCSTYMEMMDSIKWRRENLNSFDNAIWVHVDSNREKYFKKRTKKKDEKKGQSADTA